MSVREVEFDSQGMTLRGRLYEHDGTSEERPAVLIAHGLSATIDGMVAERYADAIHAAGLTVLLYDHPHFGRSDGEPRQRISAWRQARGYVDALSFLSSQPGVAPDRIALWGDSLSAGEAILVAAVDSRPAALVVQVPSCGRVAPPSDIDSEAYITDVRRALDQDYGTATFAEAPERPVVSVDQIGTPSWLEPLTAFRWFIEYGGRFGTNWHNRATRTEPVGSPPYYPVLAAAHLRIPTLFVIARNDEMPGSRTDVALMAFERVQGPKELLEIEGGHFGLLYYPGEIFDKTAAAQAAFLVRHLDPDRPAARI